MILGYRRHESALTGKVTYWRDEVYYEDLDRPGSLASEELTAEFEAARPAPFAKVCGLDLYRLSDPLPVGTPEVAGTRYLRERNRVQLSVVVGERVFAGQPVSKGWLPYAEAPEEGTDDGAAAGHGGG